MPIKLHVPIETPDTRGSGIAILIFEGIILYDIYYRAYDNGFVFCDTIEERFKPT
jgi:hypothetical protein